MLISLEQGHLNLKVLNKYLFVYNPLNKSKQGILYVAIFVF